MPKISLGRQRITRRHALRIAALGIMSSTAAAVVTQQLTAAGSQAAGDAKVPGTKFSGAGHFDEVYKGRRIACAPLDANRLDANRLDANRLDANFAVTAETHQVLIDGTALHVMTNADGTYTSIVNHYQPFRTLREVARAAVDSLGDAILAPVHHHG